MTSVGALTHAQSLRNPGARRAARGGSCATESPARQARRAMRRCARRTPLRARRGYMTRTAPARIAPNGAGEEEWAAERRPASRTATGCGFSFQRGPGVETRISASDTRAAARRVSQCNQPAERHAADDGALDTPQRRARRRHSRRTSQNLPSHAERCAAPGSPGSEHVNHVANPWRARRRPAASIPIVPGSPESNTSGVPAPTSTINFSASCPFSACTGCARASSSRRTG